MKKIILSIALILGTLSLRAHYEDVPPRMSFCGMQLSLNQSARTKVDGIINMLRRSPDHFQVLLDRANLYMPIVEEAFRAAGAPRDLIFISLVESSLNGAAVSKSKAVGFWQFKDFTGREMGLQINNQVDERKHIYYASFAAARYFSSVNQNFRNWIYAVIGYNQGPTGAISHTQKKYYGKNAMPVTGSMHRYALKALAYKLAFEKDLYKSPVKGMTLVSKKSEGETSVARLAKRFGITEAQFRSYNLWALKKSLPSGKNYMVFVPGTAEEVVAEVKDPFLEEEGYTPGPDPRTQEKYPIGTPDTKASIRHQGKFAIYPAKVDPDYGLEYVILGESEALIEVAVKQGTRVRKLREWNDLNPAQEPETGAAVRLKPLKKARYHLVAKGETLKEIAYQYGLDQAKIRKKNRMAYNDSKVYAGQKLYLKKKKPKGEKIILIDELIPGRKVDAKKQVAPKVAKPKADPPVPKVKPEVKKTTPKAKPPVKVENKKPEVKKAEGTKAPELRQVREIEQAKVETPTIKQARIEAPKAQYKIHRVAAGETMWRISQSYGVTINEIKAANKLSDHSLSVGQELKIPTKKP